VEKMKKTIVLTVTFVTFLCLNSVLFSQSLPNVPNEDSLADVLDLNLGIVPDATGNIGLGTGFDFNYGKYLGLDFLSFGLSYTKSDRSINKESNKGQTREVTTISEEILRFQPLGLKFNFGDVFIIKPGANGQLLYQERKFDKTDRSTDTFKNEESRLRSLQFNAQLEMWLNIGPVTGYLTGSMNPYTRNEETALGYDASYISRKDAQGNLVYQGPTGDYSYNSETEMTYYDFMGSLDIKDLLFGADIYLSGKFVYLSYDYTTVQSEIDNGELSTFTEKENFEKTDITGTIGVELPFLNFGDVRPLTTFNFTNSDLPQGTDQILAAGLLFLQ
jgi:hypothetical protein